MIRHSKLKRIVLALLSAAMLSLSPALWAADSAPSVNRGSMELPFPVNVAGTQLQTGKYRVEWTGNGDQVNVKIYSRGKQVASTPATLVKDHTWYDHLAYSTDEKGTKSLEQISFGKQKCSLHLQDKSASTDPQRAAK
ncbi:MAG TPA: hypothetical protein VFA85_05440 [Terriglobales bacterium]|nr:hypothetical protein [Terriglobales bacterium]